MGKPTAEQYQQALDEAIRMREAGVDDHHVAKALLNLDYRYRKLEAVYEAVEHYLNSGLAESDHTRLMNAVRAYREIDRVAGQSDDESLPI